MKLIAPLCLLALTVATSGCGKDYTYHYSEDGCDTGEHSFSSLDEECQGLQNESLNNSCAQDLRSQAFTNDGCSGTFTPQ